MRTLCFTLTDEQPGANGIIPFVNWSLDELLERAGADDKARAAFSTETIMLLAGGWQSWSPGWELEPGETNPAKVWAIPQLRKLSAAPWDCTRRGGAPGKAAIEKGEADGSFIMYLRAGSRYLVIAALMERPAAPPVCFSVSKDRRRIRAGVYMPENADAHKNRVVAELRIFLAEGYFNCKDTLKKIYAREDSFNALRFLGSGKPGLDFRPGGYASWYNHYTKIDESIILSDLEGLLKTENLIAARYLKKGEPVVFQIDDGWERVVGEWEIDRAKFPAGLAGIAARIEKAGMIPGIWLAPFLVTKTSRVFREKPHWLLKEKGRNAKARPVQAGWNPNWDGVYYCLDLSRDDVVEYLRSIMKEVIDEWGFRYLKLDFLYAGFLPGDYTGSPAGTGNADVSRGSAAEYYERAVAALTERKTNAAGLPLVYLGCGLPLGSSYRHFPLSRIGTDTKETWDYTAARLIRHEGRPSALLCLRDTIGRSFMNGTIYVNDPDVIFLRSKNCALTETEKELIALVNFLFAGQILCSDDFFALGKEDFALAKRINALYDELSADEYGALYLAKDVYRLESRSGTVSGIINLSGKAFTFDEETSADPRGNSAGGSACFSGGAWIVDRRLSPGGFRFAPHSISIYKK